MTYKEIVDKIGLVCAEHFIIQDFGYGALTDIKTVNDDGTQRVNYPYVFLNPTQSARTGQSITYRFNLIAMDVCEEEQGYSNWLEVQSSCQQYIDDILANLRFAKPLFNADLTLNVNLTPFKERFQDTVAGMTATLEIEVPNKLNDCLTPYPVNPNALTRVTTGLGYPYDGNFYPYSFETMIGSGMTCNIYTGDFDNTPGPTTLPLTGWQSVDMYALTSNAPVPYGDGAFPFGTQMYTSEGLPFAPDPALIAGGTNNLATYLIDRTNINRVTTQQIAIDTVGDRPPVQPGDTAMSTGVLNLDAFGKVSDYTWGPTTTYCGI